MESEHESREVVEFVSPVTPLSVYHPQSPLYSERRSLPNKLRRYLLRGAKILRRIKCICGVDLRAHIPSIGDTAGVPRCPSCQLRCVGDVGGVGLEVVESVCGVFADGATEDG